MRGRSPNGSYNMKEYPSDDTIASLALRDRILAYLHLMDVKAVESLEIALKVLEKPEAAEPGRAFEILLALLKEGGLDCEEAAPLARAAAGQVPPLNRQSMISEGLHISFADFLSRIVTGGFRPVKSGEGPEGGAK